MRHYSRAEMEQVYDHIVGERIPGRGAQGIHEQSITQRYEIGSRLQLGPKVYHYAYALLACEHYLGARIYNQQDSTQWRLPNPAADVPIGSWSVSINIGVVDGPLHDGSMPLNYLKGGTVLFYTAAGAYIFQRGITGNTARAAGAGALTIHLDAPTTVVLTDAGDAQVQASPYRSICGNGLAYLGNAYAPVCGVPVDAIAAERFAWIQTWGLVSLAASAAVGLAAGDRAVYFAGDGSISDGAELGDGGIALNIVGQYAGYVMSSYPGPAQGAPFFMLQLDP